MSTIDDHLTPLTDNLDNLLIDNKVSIQSGEYNKLHIYNKNVKKHLQKIWLLTPKLKLLKNVFVVDKIRQAALVTPTLYIEDNDINQFRQYIDKLESFVGDILNTDRGYCLALKSTIKTHESLYPSFTLQLSTNKKNIYNNRNELIKYDEIEENAFMGAYIELSHVWYNTSYYGLNFTVLQMKVYPEFDFSRCVFNDSNIRHDDSVMMMRTQSIPIKSRGGPALSLNKNRGGDEIKDIQKPEQKQSNLNMTFTPSVKDLLSIKDRLKPITHNNNNSDEPKPIIDPNNIFEKIVDSVLDKNIITKKLNKKSKPKIIVEDIQEENVFEEIVEDEIIEIPAIVTPTKKKNKKKKSNTNIKNT